MGNKIPKKLSENPDFICQWHKSGFRLNLFLDYVNMREGRVYLKYEFYDKGELIFSGSDFGHPWMYESSSKDVIYGLLGFLSVQEGDTDLEYFEDYTFRQLEWRDSQRCEELSVLVYDYQNRRDKR